jgi:hypothetical protein
MKIAFSSKLIDPPAQEIESTICKDVGYAQRHSGILHNQCGPRRHTRGLLNWNSPIAGPNRGFGVHDTPEKHGIIACVTNTASTDRIVESCTAGLTAMTPIDLVPESSIQVPANLISFGCIQKVVKERRHSQLDLGCRTAPVVVEMFVLGQIYGPLPVCLCRLADN